MDFDLRIVDDDEESLIRREAEVTARLRASRLRRVLTNFNFGAGVSSLNGNFKKAKEDLPGYQELRDYSNRNKVGWWFWKSYDVSNNRIPVVTQIEREEPFQIVSVDVASSNYNEVSLVVAGYDKPGNKIVEQNFIIGCYGTTLDLQGFDGVVRVKFREGLNTRVRHPDAVERFKLVRGQLRSRGYELGIYISDFKIYL